ncbi:alcohol oxidase [Mycena crocata]|nr:alcohol oxidase [Mycena crocata]
MPILSATELPTKKFDYIVIGGGTTGLTVAARLSEDPSVSVLVLEAGGTNLDDPDLLTPASFGSHFGNPKYDWALQTVPQAACQNRCFPFSRGKGLGGSSGINYFQYHRPAKSDIEAFGALGNAGWNWDLLDRYYAKAEHFVQPAGDIDAWTTRLDHLGMDGPLTIAHPASMSNFELPYEQAMKNVGIDVVKDPFSGDTNGTWQTPVTIDPQERVRSYSANKYYQPNATRVNLTVVVNAHVTKVVTELDQNGTATAVEVAFLSEGVPHIVRVGKEVILAAGAIMSPQILELSGIGDKEILEQAGVQPRVQLPGVGTNVQEHLFATVSYELREGLEPKYQTHDILGDPEVAARQKEQYKTTGTGVYAICPTSITFVPLVSISPSHEALQNSVAKSINEVVTSKQISPSLKKQYEIQLKHLKNKEPSCEFILSPGYMPGINPPTPGKRYLTINVFINHPFSRGAIHIASSDPLAPPNIDPHYFEHEYGRAVRFSNILSDWAPDLLQFVEQIKFARKVFSQEPLKKFLAGPELNPGPKIQTDQEIADYIKSAMSTTWHTVGSCSMLPLADGGVVDRTLKVYNTTNIRVVDISIVPLHIGAHLQATSYALGELAADLIKGLVL